MIHLGDFCMSDCAVNKKVLQKCLNDTLKYQKKNRNSNKSYRLSLYERKKSSKRLRRSLCMEIVLLK